MIDFVLPFVIMSIFAGALVLAVTGTFKRRLTSPLVPLLLFALSLTILAIGLM